MWRIDVTTRTIFLIPTLIVCLGLFAAAPAGAQPSTAPTWNDALSQHHQLQYQMMDEMTREMTRMTEQMSHGGLSPEDNRKMGERMARMAKMMRFMSGLEARPAHNHAQLQEQMDQMRAQMSEMMGNSRMTPGAR
jgi:hypothetical protein